MMAISPRATPRTGSDSLAKSSVRATSDVGTLSPSLEEGGDPGLRAASLPAMDLDDRPEGSAVRHSGHLEELAQGYRHRRKRFGTLLRLGLREFHLSRDRLAPEHVPVLRQAEVPIEDQSPDVLGMGGHDRLPVESPDL